jgi:hypothetical protein
MSNRPLSNKTNQHTPVPDTELIQLFLHNQSKELDIKAKEIDQQRVSDQHTFEYSKIALEKEAIDRNAHRDFVRKCRKDTFLFISGIGALITLVVGYSLYIGKDQIAMEIIKSLIFLLSGGAGGYALGRKEKAKNSEENT